MRHTIGSALSILWGLLLAAPSSSFAQSLNVTLVEQVDDYTFYNDIWGYVAPDGTELCLLGTLDGTSFIDATNPVRPSEEAFIPGPVSVPRDIKTYDHYAYIVNETGGGLQIVDLIDPLNPVLVRSDSTFFRTAHNLFIDTATAHLYAAGSDAGLVVLDLTDPVNPVSAAQTFTYFYVHDLVVRNDLAYLAAVNEGKLAVLDVTYLPVTNLRAMALTAGRATHNVWLTGDGIHALTTDETPGGHIQVFDVSNPDSLIPVAEWKHPDDPGSTIHNVEIRGDLAYIAWYKTGLQILDISDPRFPQRVGYFDTSPDSGAGFAGAWGVYPFQPSGTIYVSDMQTGAQLFTFDPNYGIVSGVIDETGSGTPLDGVRVSVVSKPDTVTTLAGGAYRLALPPGNYTLVCDRYGFQTDALPVTVIRADTTYLSSSLTPLPSGSVSGFAGGFGSYAPLEGASFRLENTPLTALSDAGGDFRFPRVPEGIYTLIGDDFGFAPIQRQVTVTAGGAVQANFAFQPAAYWTDLETAPGWTVGAPGDNATAGIWELGDPEGTACGTAQPEDDHTPGAGRMAFVTGAKAGVWMGSYDVDGGVTTLLSPVLDLSGVPSPTLRYYRWYTNSVGANPNNDIFVADVSADGGATWVNLETLPETREFWEPMEFPLDAYITPGPQVQFRFIAGDLAGGSIIEAGIDDVEIYGEPQTVGLPDTGARSAPTHLLPAHPNPFPSGTTLRFVLDAAAPVLAEIFDLRGRRTARLLNERLSAGEHDIRWDGRLPTGATAPSGIYFFHLRTPAGTRNQKLVLTR